LYTKPQKYILQIITPTNNIKTFYYTAISNFIFSSIRKVSKTNCVIIDTYSLNKSNKAPYLSQNLDLQSTKVVLFA